MDSNTRALMFSSDSMLWATPEDFFNKLNNKYKFTLDPCADHQNHKCDKYYTVEDDGLSKSWKNEIVFMNPPYGKHTATWMAKAWNEAKKGATVVCLVPARTDTRWWHRYCMRASKIYFVKGRLKFGGNQNPAPFPSAVIVFDPLSQYDLPLQVGELTNRS